MNVIHNPAKMVQPVLMRLAPTATTASQATLEGIVKV